MLNELYQLKVNEAEFEDIDKIDNFERWIFIGHFEKFLKEHQEVYENLSKYIIFSEESKRWFNVNL